VLTPAPVPAGLARLTLPSRLGNGRYSWSLTSSARPVAVGSFVLPCPQSTNGVISAFDNCEWPPRPFWIAGLACFYNEKVDLYLDVELQ
jgi:hypothetical protein